MSKVADVKIELNTGPEVLTGSTRLKAGTSQKIVLNMISTTAMVRLGKVYDNLMVDLMLLNSKLVERAIGIISKATGASKEVAKEYLQKADMKPKLAIIMIKCQTSKAVAQKLLEKYDGHVGRAIKDCKKDGDIH